MWDCKETRQARQRHKAHRVELVSPSSVCARAATCREQRVTGAAEAESTGGKGARERSREREESGEERREHQFASPAAAAFRSVSLRSADLRRRGAGGDSGAAHHSKPQRDEKRLSPHR